MHRIYHNWYSLRMKVCFVVLSIIHMIFKILIQPLKDMQINQKIQLLLL